MLTLFIAFIFNSFVLAQPVQLQQNEINLELGEDHLLTGSFSKVWIEDKKLLAVQVRQNKYYIKSLKPGLTHFRLDNTLYKAVVSPIGSKKTYSDWKILVTKFIELSKLAVDYCDSSVCLVGRLKQLSDYELILSLIKENKSKLYLALTVENDLASELQKKIGEQLRAQGITPLKVQFGTPWKVFYPFIKIKALSQSQSASAPSSSFETQFMSLGLQLQYSALATEIADNIKVAVKVVEVSKNFERKLGIRWPDSYQSQILDNTKMVWAESFDLALNAAEKAGEAKILASPNLLCRSGKEAEFFAGGEFPVKVVRLRSTEVIWKRYGIGLKLKPQIDPLGQMSLQLESEVSTLDRSITVDDVPAIHSNRVSSFFDLISSRTIALSGLIKSESSESTEGLPFLKDIPILGSLFSSKNFQENKSELVIFVTPELMN